jgi:ABC-type transport system substrate-binding protein
MTRRLLLSLLLALTAGALVAVAASVHAQSSSPKRGGILNTLLLEEPPGLLIHESATVSNVWPMSPCYSNLVLFDPAKPLESAETVIPELADRWSWQDNYRNLVFFLKKGVRFPALARRDYQMGANLTAGGFDNPRCVLLENYKCGASRNYTDYCNEETDRLIDLQSQDLDRSKRLKLVWEIQRRLEADVARPMLSWRKEYFAHWPHVKGLVAHNSLYNYGLMQNVWLDK